MDQARSPRSELPPLFVRAGQRSYVDYCAGGRSLGTRLAEYIVETAVSRTTVLMNVKVILQVAHMSAFRPSFCLNGSFANSARRDGGTSEGQDRDGRTPEGHSEGQPELQRDTFGDTEGSGGTESGRVMPLALLSPTCKI